MKQVVERGGSIVVNKNQLPRFIEELGHDVEGMLDFDKEKVTGKPLEAISPLVAQDVIELRRGIPLRLSCNNKRAMVFTTREWNYCSSQRYNTLHKFSHH